MGSPDVRLRRRRCGSARSSLTAKVIMSAPLLEARHGEVDLGPGGIESSREDGRAVLVATLRVVEEPAGGINHGVGTPHVRVVLGHQPDTLCLQPSMPLDE